MKDKKKTQIITDFEVHYCDDLENSILTFFIPAELKKMNEKTYFYVISDTTTSDFNCTEIILYENEIKPESIILVFKAMNRLLKIKGHIEFLGMKEDFTPVTAFVAFGEGNFA